MPKLATVELHSCILLLSFHSACYLSNSGGFHPIKSTNGRSLGGVAYIYIYAVHRLSNNLDEPPRSIVQSLLQKILVFKGGVKPPKSRPLQIPLLSHQGFRGTIKTWLRQAAISRKDFFSSVSPSSLRYRSCCSPFVGQITGQPSQDDGRIRLGFTANMHMPNISRTAS